jgi:hypothetical protein
LDDAAIRLRHAQPTIFVSRAQLFTVHGFLLPTSELFQQALLHGWHDRLPISLARDAQSHVYVQAHACGAFMHSFVRDVRPLQTSSTTSA